MMGSNANQKALKPADFSDIQLQIKRNAEEYRDFLSDLSSWQKEMKTKDAKAKIPPVHSSNQPPIRTGAKIQPRQHVSTSTRSTELTDLKSQNSESKKERKISGFDYNSWDKFDVDKALEDLENQEYQEYHDQKSKQKVSDQSLPPQSLIENKEMAKIEKDEGNVYFKKGKFVKAVQHYTKAIGYEPECAVYYLNRAMALLKLQRFSEAETDCTRGLEREPKNIKALWRRANARIGLGELKGAKQDLEAALVLEPTNKAIKDDLSKLQYKLPAATGVSNNAADIATHEKLGPLRRKLTVEEVEAECDIPEDHPVRLFTSRSNEVEIMKPNITSIDQSMSPPIQESVVASTVPSSVAGTFVPDVPLTSADASIPDTSKSSSSSSPAPSVFPSSTSNSIQEASSSSPNFTVSTKGLINVLPPPPTASFEFERDIKIVQNSTELLYQYLKSISPKFIPELFTTPISPENLSLYIQSLRTSFLKSEPATLVYNLLLYLSKCKRFEMTRMFLDKRDYDALNEIFKFLESSFDGNFDALKKVGKVKGVWKILYQDSSLSAATGKENKGI